MSFIKFALILIINILAIKENVNGLYNQTPQQMISDDIRMENVIYSETDALINILNKCEQIVQNAYKVTNYTPNLSNHQHEEFWKNEIIPILLTSVTQNVNARNLIIHSFGSISELSITIEKSDQMVTQSKGSAKAIKIAQTWIPNALNDLNNNLKDALVLDNNGIKYFEKQMIQLFEIIGPEATKFVDQKVEIEGKLNKLYNEQEKLFQILAEKQGEATRLNSMIIALGGKIPTSGFGNIFVYSSLGSDELNKINKAVLETIKHIPDKIKNQIRTHSVSGLSLLEKAKNNEFVTPNIDGKYYDSVIQSISKANLNINLTDLQGQYINVSRYLGNITKEFNEQLNSKQKQIDNLLQEIVVVDKKINELDNSTGLIGSSLIDCLIAVKAFATTLRTGANIYAPLASILKGVKRMVEMDVELLNSTEATDVTLALSLLQKTVKFLSSFTLDVQYVLDPSNQFNISVINHNHTIDKYTNSYANAILINWVSYIYIISLYILCNIVVKLQII